MSITAGRSKICDNVPGGLKTVWLSGVNEVTSFTLTGESYSAVTMEASNVFYKFEFAQTSAQKLEEGTQADALSPFGITQTLEFSFKGLSQTDRDALSELIDCSPCGMIAIVEDTNGVMWVLGYNEDLGKEYGLFVSSITSDTGKLLTDFAGSIITLSASQTELARTFTGTVPE